MFCGKCGVEVTRRNAKFCPKCGARLQARAKEIPPETPPKTPPESKPETPSELIVNMDDMKGSRSNGQFNDWFDKAGDL